MLLGENSFILEYNDQESAQMYEGATDDEEVVHEGDEHPAFVQPRPGPA